jgi:hypothetical protein
MSSLRAMPIRSACLAGLFTAALICGCTHEPSSGASTETTNGLMGFVTDENGKPATRALVSVWDSRGLQRQGTTYTDSTGHWRIDGLTGIVGVEVRTADGNLGFWQGGHRWKSTLDTLSEMRLRKMVDLALAGQKLTRLAGTPYTTADGLLRSIPAGSYTVLSDTSPTSFPVGSVSCGKTATDTFATVSDSGLLVDDFDDGDSTWIYGSVLGRSSKWIALQGSAGASLSAPLSDQAMAAPAMSTTGAFRGRSLHLKYTANDSTDFVAVAIDFGQRLDFSNFRSVRLRARGNGQFRVGLDGGIAEVGDFRAEWRGAPDSTWKLYKFDRPSGSAGTRKYGVFQIVISSYGGTDLWIDDIRIDGLEPAAVLP